MRGVACGCLIWCLGCGGNGSDDGSSSSGADDGTGTESGSDPDGGSGPSSATSGATSGATASDDSGSATADTSGGSGDETTAGDCEDACPAPNGSVEWLCKRRFMYGINYAWHHFAGDFGGISPWGQAGVAAQRAMHRQKLTDMADHGVSVIRWWMFPDFRGDGVVFDGSENPTGLGGTALADIDAALELADEADVYLMPTLFSFDNFRPSRDESGIWVPGMTPMIVDGTRRKLVLENVVRPVASAVEASAHADRVIAWDVINEPEWAITGPSPYGDMDYTPNGELDAVSHAQMETFIAEAIAVLREESGALVTVGGAAMKWAKAWSMVDVDFYQFHIYGWVNDYWPYSMGPADFGVDDRPVVMGEFPLSDLAPGVPYADLLDSWWGNGYAGAMAWQYDEASPSQLDAVAAFAASHPCATRY